MVEYGYSSTFTCFLQAILLRRRSMATRRSMCPIAFGLDVFGDKWTLLVVRDIALYGKRYYGEFEAAGEGIATNVLADRLRLLVVHGIIEKSRDPQKGSRRVYRLTKKGFDLLPMLVEMILWSAKYDDDSPVTRSFVRRARDHRVELLAELRGNSRSV